MQVNDQNFEEEVLKFDGIVLVDFSAKWCGTCQALAPIIDELAMEVNGEKIKIVTLDVDENPTMTEKYEVLGLPTLVFFKKGELMETMHGLQNKDVLKGKLEAFSRS